MASAQPNSRKNEKEYLDFRKNLEECLARYGDCSERFFAVLPVVGKEAVINWCMKKGLIACSYECPKCGRQMKLRARTGDKALNDGYEWRCRSQAAANAHDVSRSVRRGSWLEGSNLDISSILILMRKWFGNVSQKYAIADLGMSAKTAVDWYHFCREVCEYAMLRDSCKIGGTGVTVEIAEGEFGNMMYRRGLPVDGNWVYGGLEIGSNRCFFIVVPNPIKEYFLCVIEEWVLPGTTIISDCWNTHDCLQDEGFEHLRVKNNLEYLDPETAARRGNSTEGAWATIKRFVRGCSNHTLDMFDSYLYEYMWRRRHENSVKDDVFKIFLQDVARVFPPVNKDPLLEPDEVDSEKIFVNEDHQP